MLFLEVWLAVAALTAYAANSKGRNVAGWGIAALLLGFFPLLLLAFLPKVEGDEQKSERGWLVVGVVFAVFLLASVIGKIDDRAREARQFAVQEASASPDSTSEASFVPAPPAPEAPASVPRWSYDDGTDQMRGTHWYSATVDATEKLNFASPYSGGSTASVEVRQIGKRQDVLLLISKGQFLCHFDGCSIAAKFDDGPVVHYSGAEPGDGSSDAIFILGAPGFIAKLKRAKVVTVEAEFFQEGTRQLTFNVAALKWPHR